MHWAARENFLAPDANAKQASIMQLFHRNNKHSFFLPIILPLSWKLPYCAVELLFPALRLISGMWPQIFGISLKTRNPAYLESFSGFYDFELTRDYCTRGKSGAGVYASCTSRIFESFMQDKLEEMLFFLLLLTSGAKGSHVANEAKYDGPLGGQGT